MPRHKTAIPIERLTVMTLAEVAAKLGVTPMAVYYVEKRALKKIRRVLIARGIVTRKGRFCSHENNGIRIYRRLAEVVTDEQDW